ncbi:hypothetical protein AB0M46_38500 [Dactylosporangium sp. NPDC051485]|uniref:hypothetical protein n=1 Tax=Dactylosporangium sp. NPDC051485 TaxID=3154846 RepID=UPI003443E2A7
MSEYGEFDTGQEHGSLEAAHTEHGAAMDHQSQYGILERDHHSVEHEEYENVKHIEYTDAAGNHYEITEYTHYERTEIEDSHEYAAYGQESGSYAGFGAAEGESAGFGEASFGEASGGDGLGLAHGFGAASAASGLQSITSRFENFLGSGLFSDNDIDDASA